MPLPRHGLELRVDRFGHTLPTDVTKVMVWTTWSFDILGGD